MLKSLLNQQPKRGTVLSILAFTMSFLGLLGLFSWFLMFATVAQNILVTIVVTLLCLLFIIVGIGVDKRQYRATRVMEWIVMFLFGLGTVILIYILIFPEVVMRSIGSIYLQQIIIIRLAVVAGILLLIGAIFMRALWHFNKAYKQKTSKYLPYRSYLVRWLGGIAVLTLIVVYIFLSPYPVPGMKKHALDVGEPKREVYSGAILETSSNGVLMLKEFFDTADQSMYHGFYDVSGDIIFSSDELDELEKWRNNVYQSGEKQALLGGYAHLDEIFTGRDEEMRLFDVSPLQTTIEQSLQAPYFQDVGDDPIVSLGYGYIYKWKEIMLYDSYRALQKGNYERVLQNQKIMYLLGYKFYNAHMLDSAIWEGRSALVESIKFISIMLTQYTIPTEIQQELVIFYETYPLNRESIYQGTDNTVYKYLYNIIDRLESVSQTYIGDDFGLLPFNPWLFDREETIHRLNIISERDPANRNSYDHNYRWSKTKRYNDSVRRCNTSYYDINPLYKKFFCVVMRMKYNVGGDELLAIYQGMTENAVVNQLISQDIQTIDFVKNQLNTK